MPFSISFPLIENFDLCLHRPVETSSGHWLTNGCLWIVTANTWKADVKKGIFRSWGFFSPSNSEKSSRCNTVKTKVCERNYITWLCHLQGCWPWASVKHLTCGSCTEASSPYWSGTHVNHSTECFAALKFHRSISNFNLLLSFRCPSDQERLICVWFY